MLRRLIVAVCAAGALGADASAQYFNVDIDCNNGDPPQLGVGVPSPGFGAAANQPGMWNLFDGISIGPTPLVDLSGAATGVTLSLQWTIFYSCLDYLNTSNTGDYALLFNDASQVGSLAGGGTLTYTFAGLANGQYQLYTYASAPQGILSSSQVTVPGSTSANPQFVTGPAPGNGFALGITHSIHDILVTNNTLVVTISAPPGLNDPAYVAGFQLVPGPGGATALLTGSVWLMGARRRRGGAAA